MPSRSRASTSRPIDRIRSQIVAGIIADARDPGTAAQIAWSKAVYGDHPYSRQDEGTQATLATITADDLKTLHRRLFARDNLIIGVVGAIDAETLKKELDLLFGGLPEKAELTPVADVAAQARPGNRHSLRTAADHAAGSPIPARTATSRNISPPI